MENKIERLQAFTLKRANAVRSHGVKVTVARNASYVVITKPDGSEVILKGDAGYNFVTKSELVWLNAPELTFEDAFYAQAFELFPELERVTA